MTASSNAAAEVALELDGVEGGYGDLQVLRGVDLRIAGGGCTAVLGPNGAGKTTLMRTIAGVLAARAGTVRIHGRDMTGVSPPRRLREVGWVPEGRQLFADFKVIDNLRLSAHAAGVADRFDESLAEAVELFPALEAKLGVAAGTLSGGQQQMVAVARALVRRPRLLMLDEPSMGLGPIVVDDIRSALVNLRARGLSILIAEQNVSWLDGVVDSVALMQRGAVARQGDGGLLRERDVLRALYLGS